MRRLDDTLDASLLFQCLEIEDVERPVVLCGEPQAVPLQVVFEMIEVAGVTGKLGATGQPQRIVRGKCSNAGRAKHRTAKDRNDS